MCVDGCARVCVGGGRGGGVAIEWIKAHLHGNLAAGSDGTRALKPTHHGVDDVLVWRSDRG